LVQQSRSDDLSKAVAEARPLLEQRIDYEVDKFDLSGPEGRARALHAAAQHVRRVNDDIARREYARYVARLIGVDLETAERAVQGGPAQGGDSSVTAERPLDRAESELLRVVLTNPPDMIPVMSSDFSDESLRSAFEAVSGALATVPPGAPIDVSTVSDPHVQGILRELVMDSRPLPDWSEMADRLLTRRLITEIESIEAELGQMESGTEPYSEALRRLIALQQQKRSRGTHE